MATNRAKFLAMRDHLRGLLKAEFLSDDAKADVRFMLRLHESRQYRLDGCFTDSILYTFLINAQSRAGGKLRAYLRGYSGDMLHETMSSPRGDMDISVHFQAAAISEASRIIGTPLTSEDFLISLLVYAPAKDNRAFFEKLRDRQSLAEVTSWTGPSRVEVFLRERLIDFNGLAMALRDFGPRSVDPDHLIERFSLAIRILDSGRLRAEIVERWGQHPIAEDSGVVATRHGLWLPERVLFLPQEIEEFELLLNRNPPSKEEAFQRFFEEHPKWLFLLGEQYEASSAQIELPPLQVQPDLALLDSGADNMALRPDFLLKRIGLELWDVLDIKRSDYRVAVGRASRRKFSEAVADSVAQLREYQRRLQHQEVRAYLKKQHGFYVAEPVAMVLIGRDFEFRTLGEKARLQSDSGVRVYTYDDLRRLAKNRALSDDS